jgi:monoamine oxidase
MSTDWDVVIIGGGAAGIAAARRLATKGVSTLLLEASQRIGGRAHTVNVAGHALDLGCGWLHSADRNPWVGIAEASGFAVERRRSAWSQQYRDLGFSPEDQDASDEAYAAWHERLMSDPPQSDCAADALEPGGTWNGYLQAMSGYISGAGLERLSIADYLAYDTASTRHNWRVPDGYGALIAASLPPGVALRLATPVEAIDLEAAGVSIATRTGNISARTVILTVSTAVIVGETIRLPPELDEWRHAAANLPLGRNEKLFLEIVGTSPFEPETHVIGDPRNPRTGSYYIRPFGRAVIEGFFGGEGAEVLAGHGPAAGFAYAIDELAALFGSGIRRSLRPLAVSNWTQMDHIGGGYSYALPGKSEARVTLAHPLDGRLFFAGEATHRHDFSTAHGAYQSGVRAADEVMAALRPSAP